MNKFLLIIAIVVGFSGCQSTPSVEGFNSEQWKIPLQSCEDSRIQQAQILVNHQNQLLGCGQTQIKSLLGAPNEHELYLRTQKFFYYNLTPGDTCSNVKRPLRLSIMFDALDRAKEVMIIE